MEEIKVSIVDQVLSLSKKKWQYIQEANVSELVKVYHEKSVSVHIGAIYGKYEELEIIGSRKVVYKEVHIKESRVQVVRNTAILLHKMQIVAGSGEEEYINSFVVTEVFVNENKQWEMISVSFTKIESEESAN